MVRRWDSEDEKVSKMAFKKGKSYVEVFMECVDNITQISVASENLDDAASAINDYTIQRKEKKEEKKKEEAQQQRSSNTLHLTIQQTIRRFNLLWSLLVSGNYRDLEELLTLQIYMIILLSRITLRWKWSLTD
ncbi:hypothetical protein LWI28_003400 [Acer negundo]|uniref:Uncharacterized protein n=1 Tax=Acer negundo TaxID=4023 RepID=A0AAD5JD49_ACENE|nr:hypothetical protein LWI28_003400 [Acer negundo]